LVHYLLREFFQVLVVTTNPVKRPILIFHICSISQAIFLSHSKALYTNTRSIQQVWKPSDRHLLKSSGKRGYCILYSQ
jgi:hypothetical protein